MGKKTNTDLLASILTELSELVENAKGREGSKNGSATEKALSSSLNPSTAKQLKDTGNGLLNIVNAIKAMGKIDENDKKNMISIFNSLQDMMEGMKMDEEKAKAFSLFMSSFGKMNDTFMALSQNFFKSFRAFSPLKGKLLGKRLAGFYKAISDAFKGSESVKGAGELLTAIGSLDGKKMVQMSQWMRLLHKSGGQSIADFLLPIIKVINEMPAALENKSYKRTGLFSEENNSSWVANPKIAGFISILNALASLSSRDVSKLSKMGRKLNAEKGEKIGGFFHAFLSKFTPADTKRAETADKVIKSITILFGTLTASLIALTILAAVGKEKVIYGLGLLAIMCFTTFGIIKLLSGREIKSNAKGAVFTALSFAAIITALTLSLLLCVKIAKDYKIKEILGGILILSGLILFSLATMSILSSKKIQENSVKSLVTIAGVVLMLISLSLVARIFVKNGKNWKDILKGTAVTTAVFLAGIGLIYLGAQLAKGSTIVKGFLGLAAVIAAIMGIALAVREYGYLLKEFKNMSDKDILIGSGITLAIIAATGAAMFAIGALLSGPQAAFFAIGFAGIETIALVIHSLGSAIDTFVSMLEHTNKLTPESVKSAKNIITGRNGMVDCIKEIVDGLDNISVKKSRQIKKVAKNLNPVFKGLSNFVDIIQKMGNMTMFDGYDDNGNPIYKKMSNTVFADAANTLSEGFTNFLNKLFDTFEGRNAGHIKRILKALRKGGIAELMSAVGTFGQTVVNLAQMRIPDSWDSNGNPTHYLQIGKGADANKVFISAAETLSSAFTEFLNKLNSTFVAGPQVANTKAIIKALKEGGITELMSAIGQFGETIATLATGQIPVYEDANDPTKITRYVKPDYKNAATLLTDSFSTFINKLVPLQAKVKNIDVEAQNEILELITTVFSSFAKLNSNDFEKNKLYDKVKYVGKTLSLFASYLVLFNNQLKPVGGVKNQSKLISNAFDKIGNAIKKFDNELLSKAEKRQKALDNLANKFAEINTNIEKLNANFAKSADLMRQYDNLQNKQNNGLLSQVADTFKGHANNSINTFNRQNGNINEKSAVSATIDPTPIVAAIIDGLNQWADTQKIVSVQFGDNDAKKLRGYIN